MVSRSSNCSLLYLRLVVFFYFFIDLSRLFTRQVVVAGPSDPFFAGQVIHLGICFHPFQQAPGDYETARRLVEHYRDNEAVTIDPTEGSVVARLDIQDTGQQASLFFVRKAGTLHVWAGTIGDQLEKAGLPRGLVDPYEALVRGIFQLGEDRKELARSVGRIDIDAFMSAADAFIEMVQRAESVYQ